MPTKAYRIYIGFDRFPDVSDENCITTSTESSPKTVKIMFEKQDEVEKNTLSEDLMISFYTADTHEPGSQQNPIDIDQFFIQLETPHPAINIL